MKGNSRNCHSTEPAIVGRDTASLLRSEPDVSGVQKGPKPLFSYYSTAIINSGFDYPIGVAFSPSGTYAYVTNFNPSNVVIIDTATNTVTNSIPSGLNGPNGVAFSPSGTYAYVVNYGSTNVAIINTATNTVTNSIISGFSTPSGVSFSPSGTYAYVTNPGTNNVVIINTATNTVTGSITSGFSNPTGVSFSPSGTYAYVTNGNSNNTVVINTATNSVTGSITSGFQLPSGVAFSPSGTYAYIIAYAARGSPNHVMIINPGIGAETTNLIDVNVNVNPALGTPKIFPSNPSIDTGQSIILTGTWSGGTPDYTAKLYSSTTSTCNQPQTQ